MRKDSQIRLALLGALLIPLLWLGALIGTSYPRYHALLISVNGLTLADYSAEAANLSIAPLTTKIYHDAYQDAVAAPALVSYPWYGPTHHNLQAIASPVPSASASPKPSASTTPSPSATPTPTPTPSRTTTPTPPPTPSLPPTPTPAPSPTPAPTPTPTPPTTDPYTVPAGTTYDGDFVVSGHSVTINGTVTGDVKVTNGEVTVNGTVDQSVVVTSGNVTVRGTVKADVQTQSGSVLLEASASVGGDVAISNGTLTWRSGCHVTGSATINGADVTPPPCQ